MPTLTTPNLCIHYRQAGQGQHALVFLHGNYASSRWWVPQLERLPVGWRGYAPDLRGCGGAEGRTQHKQQTDNLAIAALVDDLAQFVTALNLNNFILAGHSLGGAIAIEYALAYPDKLIGLVLADSAPPGGMSLAASLAQPLALPLSFGSQAMMRKALQQVGLPNRGQLAEELVNDALSTNPAQYVAFSKALSDWNVEAKLPGLRIPTLLIWGRNDAITPRHIGKRYAELLPEAQLVVIPRAGHSSQIEQPDRFAEALVDFIAQLAPAQVEPEKKSRRERLRTRLTQWIKRLKQTHDT